MTLRSQIPLLAGGSCYLDNAATSLMPETVLAAVRNYDDSNRGNVGRGVHRFAEAADEAFEKARQTIATAISAKSDEVVLTSGCTAALNMLTASLAAGLTQNDTVLLCIAEHHSHIVPWRIAAHRCGVNIVFFGIDNSGAPDVESATRAIKKYRPRVVAFTHVSNVSGGIADVAAIAAAAHEVNAQVVVDGAQYAPHRLPDVAAMDADFYVFSGHKCYAPNGIGVLWGKRKAWEGLSPSIGGGGSIKSVTCDNFIAADMPQRWEAGTPPITNAIGLAQAITWMQSWHADVSPYVGSLSQKLRAGLADIADVRLLFNNNSPIVSFVIDGIHSHDICEWLAARDIATRGGHHCAQPLMDALQINGCARASIAPYNNDEDIEKMLAAVAEAAARLK